MLPFVHGVFLAQLLRHMLETGIVGDRDYERLAFVHGLLLSDKCQVRYLRYWGCHLYIYSMPESTCAEKIQHSRAQDCRGDYFQAVELGASRGKNQNMRGV